MKVTYTSDLHSHANTTLDRTSNIVTVPSSSLGNASIDACRSEEACEILDPMTLDGSQEDETN